MKHFNILKKLGFASALLLGMHGQANAAITTGTYTIGSGGSYATLADAIADVGTLSGTIVFNVLPGTYSGTGWQQVQIPAFSGASSTNRVVIQASSGAGTVSISDAGSSSANYMLQLNGTQYLTIKNISITNTSTSYGRVVEFTGSASNDSLLGCSFIGQSTTSTSNARALIYAANASSMSNIVAMGNTFSYGSHGICWLSSGATLSSDNVFSYNTFSNNYYSYIYSQYLGNVTIKNNTCSATGVGSHYGFYLYYPQNSFTVTNNTINTTGTGSIYGVYNTYGNYSTPTANEVTTSNNTITLYSSSATYGIYYYYYCKMVNISNNTLTQTSTGSTNYGIYIYQYCDNIKCNNNTLNLTAGSSNYGIYGYWNNYGMTNGYVEYMNNNVNASATGSGSDYAFEVAYHNYTGTNCTLTVKNNTIVTTTSSSNAYNYGSFYVYYNGYGTNNTALIRKNNITASSGYYLYATYMYGNFNAVIDSNNFTGTLTGSSGYCYVYGPAYYSESVKCKYNNFTFTDNTSYGYVYNYAPFDYNSGNSAADTMMYNTLTYNATNGGSYYNYQNYLGGYSAFNTITANVKSGYIYNYAYYSYGGLAYKNKLTFTSTTGGIYGYQGYGYSSYPGATWVSNTFDMTSTSGGTIYACGGYTPGNDKFISNVFTAKTSGSTYMFYEPSYYGNNADMYYINNTFHSASTGSTNYLIYKQGTGYPGVAYLYNNIFSRSDGTSTNPAIYINDTTYWQSDYNLYYTPGTVSLRGTSTPSINTTSLQAWRKASNRDRNSLIYDPGFLDAANKNVHPDPLSPNSWAVNGRGRHIDGDTLDADGVMRPKTRQDGVPDLGAYEVSPTSTPPACTAIPAAPAAGTTQYFLFGQDTAASIAWGPAAPSTAVMRQYSGQQAGAPMPSLVGRSYLWLDLFTNGVYALSHTPTVYYKDPQLGTISTEANAKIANSSNGSPWVGYNYGNAATDPVLNKAYPTAALDSVGKYTIVENARIGIRCVINPTNVKVSNITAFTADVNWDAVFLPIGYQVIVDNSSATPASGVGSSFATTNTISLTTLTENTHYYVHVRSICGVKDTSGWTTVDFTTLITCHTPQPKLITLTQSRAILYWDTVQTATKYEYVIQHAPTPSPAFGTVLTTNSLQLPLAPASDYYVFVKAYCNSIYPESEWGVLGFSTFPTAINTISGNSIGLSAYPNPVTDVLHVDLTSKIDGEATLTVTDVTGKQVRSIVVNANQVEVNMNGLPAGVYQLKYSDRSHVDVMKVSKQ
ncbi:MAG: T9SS type A sorting domain-containing protein [Flavipsychrobacter sp.]